MKTKLYLTVNRDGFVRATKRVPSLYRDEIAVALTVTIPDGAFRSPILATVVDVPEETVIQPAADVQVVDG